MQFTTEFKSAFNDYLNLLTKKYPQKSILKLVGDRYKLSGEERTILYRGVTPISISESRKNKLRKMANLSETELHIDGLNQLLSIASYLNGSVVFICTDGFLRDASEIHGNAYKVKFLEKSCLILFQYLKEFTNIRFFVYLDEKVNQSKSIALKMKSFAANENLSLDFVISDKVDQKLKNITTGYIATSDSQIIDKGNVPVIDLAQTLLEKKFNPYFLKLGSFQNKII